MSPKVSSLLQHVLSNAASTCTALAASGAFPQYAALLTAVASACASALAFWHLPQPPKPGAAAPASEAPKAA